MPETPQGVWSKQMATNHQESKMKMKTMYSYSILSTSNHRVTSDAILAEFNRLALPIPHYFLEMLYGGIRYSYQDFDVLSALMNELYKHDPDVWARIGKEVK